MRPVLLISVILALIFMPSAATAVKQKPEKGYRRIKNLDAFLSNTVARFAEYDAPGWYVPIFQALKRLSHTKRC
jgi:hypothetical protein